MSTIFKTRISQQEVQTPTLSATAVVTDNFITSSIQSESVASENINATTVQGEEIIANDLSTENIAISNDLSIGQDVIVPSGNVLVGRRGIVSFVDDGEEVDENGASGFPIYNGVPEVLNNSTVYNIGEIDKDIDLSNIRFGGNDNMVQTCEIWFSTPANTTRSAGDTYEITWPENVVWLDSTDGNAPAIVKGTEYRIVLRKENEQIVASIAYAIGEGQQSVDEMIREAAQKDGDNTFTGANTFTGSVDMSGAQVTPPEGWNVGELTPEAIQQVVPMAWDENCATFGEKASARGGSVSVGYQATSIGQSTAIGLNTKAYNKGVSVGTEIYSIVSCRNAIVVGNDLAIGASTSITIGQSYTESVDGSNAQRECKNQGTGSITIGAGANTLNNGDTESSNSVTIGCKAENKGADSVVLGASVNNKGAGNVTIGAGAQTTYGDNVIAIGANAKSIFGGIAIGTSADTINGAAVVIGNSASGQVDSVSLGRRTNTMSYGVAIGTEAHSNATKTITIGNSATITNTTNADNTVTPSENTIAIGYGATASAPNAVVMGAGASNTGADSVVIGAQASGTAAGTVVMGAGASASERHNIAIGAGAKANDSEGLAIGTGAIGGYYSVAIGNGAKSTYTGVAIGQSANGGNRGIAVGYSAKAAGFGTSIGMHATGADDGVVVFSSLHHYDDGKTQLYFSGANTPLANEYYNGEAMMGYTVTDKNNNVLACGTRRLSELFTDNTLTQPTTLDENGEWVMPKVFHPSDLDLPVEELTEEPEDIIINIPEPTLPEPEEYQPLPVYPIVEPEIEEI